MISFRYDQLTESNALAKSSLMKQADLPLDEMWCSNSRVVLKFSEINAVCEEDIN